MYPIGSHVTNASLSSAVAVTVPEGARTVRLQAIDQNIRFTDDGGTVGVAGTFASTAKTATTPTASVGFQIKTTEAVWQWDVVPGQVLTFIEEAATATLCYQFYG